MFGFGAAAGLVSDLGSKEAFGGGGFWDTNGTGATQAVAFRMGGAIISSCPGDAVDIEEAVDCAGGGAAVAAAYDIEAYGRQLSPRPGLQAHRIIQDAWAKANVPGYSRYLAPSILLPRAQHVIVNALQTARQVARILEGGVGAAWSSTFDQEVANARSDLEAARVPEDVINRAIQAALNYFASLGVTPSP